jgi:hypothetical protein
MIRRLRAAGFYDAIQTDEMADGHSPRIRES